MDNPYVKALLASWELALKVVGYGAIVSFLFAIGGGSSWVVSALIALFVGLTYGYHVPDREGDKTWWLGVFVCLIVVAVVDLVAIASFGTTTAVSLTMTVVIWLAGGSLGGYLAIRERTAQRIANEQIEPKEMLAEDTRPETQSSEARGNLFPAMDIIAGLFLVVYTPIIMTGDVGNMVAAIILWLIFAAGGAWLLFTGATEMTRSFALEGGEVAEGKIIGSWLEDGRDLGRQFFVAYEATNQTLFEQVDGPTYEKLNAGDAVKVRQVSGNPMVARLELA